jgi:hypothetical protein
MLAKILPRNLYRFSQAYYQSSVLEYPVYKSDENALKNKALMDEVNQQFLNTLKKVKLNVERQQFKLTKKF